MISEEKAEELLLRQTQMGQELKGKPKFSPEFNKWRRDTQVTVQRIFGENTRHIQDFNNVNYNPGAYSSATQEYEVAEAFRRGLDNACLILRSMIEEIKEFGLLSQSTSEPDAVSIVLRLCNKFHLVARQLRSRHDNRDTLEVEDEYDVQDLMHALLRLHFDDIRPEEWTPSYAGSSARMDFLLKKEQIVLEIKKTRKGLVAKEVGEQLIVDIQKYKEHRDCKQLICFVYDPEGRIPNPAGIETDLSKDRDGLNVLVVVAPKGT